MLATLRTFRLTAALMAALLLLSGSLPLVQHACAMAQRDASARAHPCSRHGHSEAPAAHDMHEGMDASLLHTAEPPCALEASPRAEPGECCTVEQAQGITVNGVRPLKRSLAPLMTVATVVAVGALPPRPGGPSPALFFDVGPPPAASVSLHLVHSVLLD